MARARVDEVRGAEAAWGSEGEEGGPGPLWGDVFPLSFLCLSFVLYDTSLLSGGRPVRGAGERVAPV